MNKTIIISGAEMCGTCITGIPRYMKEIITHMDAILDRKRFAIEICVCYPEGKEINIPRLNNIKLIPIAWKTGTWTTTISKYVRKRKGTFVGMANNYSLNRHSILTIHDVRRLESKNYDSRKNRIRFRISGYCINFFSRKIVTVSEYQKKSIIKYIPFIDENKVMVISPGWEHIKRIKEDRSILTKNPNIKQNEYYYALGSIAKHKNYKWIYEVAKRNPDKQFVVAGAEFVDKWGISSKEFDCRNIVYVGNINDEENVCLLKNCRAFIQPSLYEGFGLPPLEALVFSKPLFVSDATCLPEVYGKAATVFSPNDYSINLDNIIYPEAEVVNAILKQHSWEKAAMDWLNLFLGEK